MDCSVHAVHKLQNLSTVTSCAAWTAAVVGLVVPQQKLELLSEQSAFVDLLQELHPIVMARRKLPIPSAIENRSYASSPELLCFFTALDAVRVFHWFSCNCKNTAE